MEKGPVIIDFDGVIANTPELKSDWIRKNLNLLVPSWHTDRENCIPLIGEQNYERMAEEVYTDSGISEILGMRNGIYRLKSLGFKLYVLTSRAPNRQQYARKWLSEKGLMQYFEDFLCIDGSSKAPFIERLSPYAVIDDEMRFLMNLDNNLLKILLTTPQHCKECKIGDNHTKFRNQSNVICASQWETAVNMVEYSALKSQI